MVNVAICSTLVNLLVVHRSQWQAQFSLVKWISLKTINGLLWWDQWLRRVHSMKDDWDKPPSPPPIVLGYPSPDRSDKWRAESHSSSLPAVHHSWVSCIEVVTYCEAEPIRAHITHHSRTLPSTSTTWQVTPMHKKLCVSVCLSPKIYF